MLYTRFASKNKKQVCGVIWFMRQIYGILLIFEHKSLDGKHRPIFHRPKILSKLYCLCIHTVKCWQSVIRYLKRHLNFIPNLTRARTSTISICRGWIKNLELYFLRGQIYCFRKHRVNAQFFCRFFFFNLSILQRSVCLHIDRGLDALYKCQ